MLTYFRIPQSTFDKYFFEEEESEEGYTLPPSTKRAWHSLRNDMDKKRRKKAVLALKQAVIKHNGATTFRLEAMNTHQLPAVYMLVGRTKFQVPSPNGWTIAVDNAMEQKFRELDFTLIVTYHVKGGQFEVSLNRENFIFTRKSKNPNNAYISVIRIAKRRLLQMARTHVW